MQQFKHIFRLNQNGQTRFLAHIAGRPNLPGPGFPQSLSGPKENLPYIIRAQDYEITKDSSPEKCAEAVK